MAGRSKQTGRRRAQVIPRTGKSGETTFLVRVPMGTDANGKRIYWTTTVHGKQKDAEAVATEKLNERDKHTLVQPSRMSLDAYLDHWLHDAAKPRLRPRTYASYEALLARHVRKPLGARRLSDITPRDIQACYATMLENGLAARTVRYVHAVLSSALKQAVRWQMLPRNPAEFVDLPRQQRQEMHALAPEEATRFLIAAAGGVIESANGSTLALAVNGAATTLAVAPSVAVTLDGQAAELHDLAAGDAAGVSFGSHGRVASIAATRTATANTGDRYHTLFDFALATGMRPGEYLALRWTDVDLKKGIVTVQRALSRVKGEGYLYAEPKTSRSRRSIPLPASTGRLLEAWKKRQSAEIMAAGEAYERNGLVFAADNGRPLHEGNLVRRHFKPTLRRAALPDSIRLYDLRHTCATLLLAAGVNPKIVSERLGHASITLTLDTYSHVLPTMQTDAADRLEHLLHGAH